MTLLAQRGGENMSDKIYNGKIKSIEKSKGKYTKGKRRILLSIIGIGDAIINWNKTPPGVSFPKGADIQVKMRRHDDGRWFVKEIVSIDGKSLNSQQSNNTNSRRNTNNRSKKTNNRNRNEQNAKRGVFSRLLKGAGSNLRKLYLYAMGGSNIDLQKLESRAQSLAPFIEYTELAKKSQEHLKKRARFVWEVVPEQKRITVTKRQGFDIRVRRERLPYVVSGENSHLVKSGAEIINLKSKTTAEIINIRVTDEGTEFSTDTDLKTTEGWKFYNENLESFQWSHNRSLRPISSITIGDKEIKFKPLETSQEWFEFVLVSEGVSFDDNSDLKFDGQYMYWETVPGSDIYGPLRDSETDRQVVSRVRKNDSIVVDLLPNESFLYDANGVKHLWKDVTKTTKDVTLKITLDPKAEALLDEERDVNPLDVLFSPDTEYRELNVTGHDKDTGEHIAGGKIKVFSKRDNREIEVKMTSIRIKSRDIERQTITVDRVPPNPNAILTLSPNAKYLERQRDMLLMLRDKPLAHHDKLLRLTEQGNKKERDKLWSDFELEEVTDWKILTDEKYDGTLEQRDFVRRALSTPDFAILQGPPGSGKTTAIIELITQFALQKKKVLLCGSTQASIDNVLTRIKGKPHLSRLISPLRIGWKRGIYDEGVHDLVLDEQIEQYRGIGLSEEEAIDLILRQSNLTCGTMQGILQHPRIAGEASSSGRLLRDPQPEWDVLIIDEASKTTFQQFIVPAGFAKKWVLVGDICQLSPFLEASELMTNLDQMRDENGNLFTPASQRACLIINQLQKFVGREKSGPREGQPIVFIEPSEVPTSFMLELNAATDTTLDNLQICLLSSKRSDIVLDNCIIVPPSEVKTDLEANLYMLSSDIIICGSDCYETIADLLPPHSIIRNGRFEESEVTKNREEHFGNKDSFGERHPMSSQSLNHDWSHEITWRLNRSYELKNSNNNKMQDNYERQIQSLLPKSQNVKTRIEEVRSIALPSVLECLQEGFASKDARKLLPETTLTQGFSDEAKVERFTMIKHQHRMNAEISEFSRNEFYNGEALKDANTIAERNQDYPFEYRKGRSRSVWLDVASKINSGVNSYEIAAIRKILEEFIDWARNNPPPKDNQNRDDNQRWEVALLSPYSAQRKGLRDMVRSLTGMQYETRFDLLGMKNPSNVMLVVNSSDRFQGQEADVVFLSLRNGSRIGFLDSPSRMNVALTRAREMRIVVGNHDLFSGKKKGRLGFSICNDPMLNKLASSHKGKSIERVKEE